MLWMVLLAAAAGAVAGWMLSSLSRTRGAARAAPPRTRTAKRRSEAPRHDPPAAVSAWGRHEPRRFVSPSEAVPAPKALDPQQRRLRIRDRYIAARFAGTLRDASELSDPHKVIKAARLYFEDGNPARADELLALAATAAPRERSLWLARLEILFLGTDTERFVETASAFAREHAGAEEWDEVARLGRRLAPTEPLFHRVGEVEPDPSQHYGPWPNLPNWIEAPWDLTAEVAGADFHARMRRRFDRLVSVRSTARERAAR